MKNVLISMIQQRRIQKGLNFQDIEQAIGIPAKRMYHFEKGNVHLSLNELEQLMKLLDLDQRDIITAPAPRKRRWKWLATIAITLILVALSFTIYPFLHHQEPPNVQQVETNPSVSETDISPTDQNEEISILDSNEPPSTVIRFWGTIPYDFEQLPRLDHSDVNPTLEVFPIEYLHRRDELPIWLSDRDTKHTLLNFATRYIWDEETIKERDRLNKQGIKNIGLDYVSEAYKPYILETEDGRIGILAFTRHILEYRHIAQEDRIGLARIYETTVLTEAIRSAKEQVDVLIVLMGWGEREERISEELQQQLAETIANAGADVIVGNHPLYAQEIRWLENTPVFYSLGHLNASALVETKTKKGKATATNQDDGMLYCYVLDVELSDGKISQYTVHPGKWQIDDHTLHFDLTVQEKSQFESQIFPSVRNNLQIP